MILGRMFPWHSIYQYWSQSTAMQYNANQCLLICWVHCTDLTHQSISDRYHQWFRQCLVACSEPSHYLNQWCIVKMKSLPHPIQMYGQLTHWGRDKMAAIFQTTFSNAFSWMKMYEFRLKFHWSFVLKGPTNSIPALVLIMAWHQTGAKPLSEPMVVYFTDAYMSLSLNNFNV